jgi:hypothetical protein
MSRKQDRTARGGTFMAGPSFHDLPQADNGAKIGDTAPWER